MNKDQSKTSILGWVAAACVAILPFVISRHLFYGAVNAKYFFIMSAVSVLALAGAVFYMNRNRSISIRGRWLLGGLALVLGVNYLSAFLGVFPEGSLWSDMLRSSGVFFLSYVGLAAFLLSEFLGARDWRLVRRAIAVSSGLFAFLTFFSANGFGIVGRLLTVNFEIQGLTFANTTFAGAYLLIGLFVVAIEWVRSEKRGERIFFGILAVVHMISPLLFAEKLWLGAQSLSGLLANPADMLGVARASSATMFLAVICCAGLALIRRFSGETLRERLSLVWGGVFAAGVLVAVFMLFVPGSIVQEKYIEQASAARVIVWEEGLRAFAERPILGWGPENFRFAHENQFDRSLYLKENLGEIWFDRAHNVVVDTLSTVGAVGALAMVLMAVLFLRAVFRARRVNIIGFGEAVLLAMIPFAHFLQLQTAFDTVGTYALMGVLLGYVLWLERETVSAQGQKTAPAAASVRQSVAAVLAVLGIVGLFVFVGREYGRQNAFFTIFTTKEVTAQIPLIEEGLSRPSNFEAMRLASASLIKGSFDFVPKAAPEEQGAVLAAVLEQLDVYGNIYATYLEKVPTDYRAHMGYAYLLIVETVYGKDRLEEARVLVEAARPLSPGHPLTAVMDTLVTLYSGHLKEAQEIITAASAENPDNDLLKNVAVYVDKQAEQFPVISILKLENI